jgi:DnaJ-class molecular chaperone
MTDATTNERPGDEVPPDSAAAGEDICPRCSGNGEVDGDTCPECRGEGVVQEGVGGA